MMPDCHPSLLASGDTCIAWVATHLRSEFMTPLMLFFSELGEVGPILFTIALSYWLWNKRRGKYLGYGLFIAILTNLWLKGVIQECRPPSQYWLEQVGSYSFPSGHSQIGVYLWFGFAYYLRRSWQSLICVLIGLMIALSRVYLGVHYPQDIVAGALIGLCVLGLILWFEKKKLAPLGRLPLWGQTSLLIAFFMCYKIIVNDPRGGDVATIGATLGFWLGCQYEMRLLHFQAIKSPLPLLGQLFIGCAGIVLFWKGGDWLTAYLPDEATVAVKYIQYFLIGFWITFGAPALKLRLGFVKQQTISN